MLKYKTITGGVTAPKGFLAAGVEAAIKKAGKLDLAVLYSEVPAVAAGVYTTNKVKAAPLLVTMEHLQDGKAQAVLVNSGNANSCTGVEGLHKAKKTAAELAALLNIEVEDTIVTSTGVIGVQLPVERVLTGLKKAVQVLSVDGGHSAAEAIMTTDTSPKEMAVQLELGGQTVTIGAMCKGSGMIHPNMATMLGFITTDANISTEALNKALKYCVFKSFNMVSVDGDTSTNDMVVALANGMASNKVISLNSNDFILFRDALLVVCINLAKSIARDGEGATKLVEVQVKNALTEEDAKKVAMAVCQSSLVKTAIFGADANWGRIICATGYADADIDPNQIDIYLGAEKMAEKGIGVNFSEDRAREILEGDTIVITIDLNLGDHEATVWGCDLTYEYVKINADYRT